MLHPTRRVIRAGIRVVRGKNWRPLFYFSGSAINVVYRGAVTESLRSALIAESFSRFQNCTHTSELWKPRYVVCLRLPHAWIPSTLNNCSPLRLVHDNAPLFARSTHIRREKLEKLMSSSRNYTEISILTNGVFPKWKHRRIAGKSSRISSKEMNVQRRSTFDQFFFLQIFFFFCSVLQEHSTLAYLFRLRFDISIGYNFSFSLYQCGIFIVWMHKIQWKKKEKKNNIHACLHKGKLLVRVQTTFFSHFFNNTKKLERESSSHVMRTPIYSIASP